jgi:transcriptional regulator with XRE-family HTH domain
MSDSASLLRNARKNAGLSQAQLAGRLGVSQAAVAKLERVGSNPTIAKLDDVLQSMGLRLELTATQRPPGIDETLVAQQLRLSADERIGLSESMYAWGRKLNEAGARARGELA